MVASPEPEETPGRVSVYVRATKNRSHSELAVEWVFGPLARLVTRLLLPLRVAPAAVVLANAATGLLAAFALATGDLVGSALLLQLKTVLDNADGQLARTSGRTSALGRYLDTEADLVVNAAVFAALAYETGSPVLALAGFCALTILLSADFNLEVVFRRVRGEDVITQPSAREEGAVARFLERLYALVFAPQDRFFQAISRRRLERILVDVSDPDALRHATLAYHDGGTLRVFANLGLSTQLAVLGLCLLTGAAAAYLWLTIVLALGVLPAVQLRSEHLARRAVASGTS
jgi:archaetidylinositol phosphate synthase